ncbi:hypothetical protein E1N52_43535 [Paraburkholderia guartelaensis]|uniref:Uncharacterized protein n=1 Tax=Paraburkholderia guartelaensis TaxID=2546446 RepID=A0A4R5KIR1_9BURK|nr:hypothetical protein [Paraburkholderia guartelaensis]TDF95371.1 hypothetical protein E1N52_43535 [Paraburkholderia guartelaensis]
MLPMTAKTNCSGATKYWRHSATTDLLQELIATLFTDPALLRHDGNLIAVDRHSYTATVGLAWHETHSGEFVSQGHLGTGTREKRQLAFNDLIFLAAAPI